MKKLIISLTLLLTACVSPSALGGAVNGSSTSVCERTIKDEQALIAVNSAYKGFRLGVETGVRAGLIKGQLAGQLADADNKIFAAIQTADGVYRTCNGDLGAALVAANNAVSAGLTLAGSK